MLFDENGVIACPEIYKAAEHYYGNNPVWFTNIDNYTVVDLILRDWLNNGCFNWVGLSHEEGLSALNFILEYSQGLILNNQISKDAYNASGYMLWDNWRIDEIVRETLTW